MTHTELETALRELARIRSGSEPIVSLHLDVRWADEQQRERVRLFVQEAIRRALAHYPQGSPGRAGLEGTFGRIREWVSGLTGQAHETGRQGMAGMALFACESLGLWRPLAFARPVENDLATDAVPHLMQLARLARDAAPVLVAVPGREGADLFSVRLGDVELEEGVRSPAPRGAAEALEPGATRPAGREGPASRNERPDRDVRHEAARVQRSQRAAAARLVALLDARPGAAIVVVGPARTVAAFERDLPERVRARVVARVPRPRGWASDGARKDAVLGVAAKAHQATRAGRRPDRLVGEALRGGIAVVGPEDVTLALAEGRVQALVVEEDLERAGWRCDNCDALGASAGSAETCPFCGGELHVVHDLAEALVARTLAVGGTVDVVPREKRLHGYGGVGAFLRQTAPTGLRGASPPGPTAHGATHP